MFTGRFFKLNYRSVILLIGCGAAGAIAEITGGYDLLIPLIIPPSYIDRRENIETVMNTFSKTGAWNLPVLDNGYYVGFISKSRIYSTYRELLIQF